jgi:molecular chaperone IbpA
MRSAYDFSPLFRSTVGFDRLPGLLDSISRLDETSLGFPPYDIEKLDEESYRITLAVAGFSEDELDVEIREQTLVVTGRREGVEEQKTFLHRGIAGLSFERRFQVADHVKVTGARLENGLLRIDLVREIPEEMKPRQIRIEISPGLKRVTTEARNAA